MSYDVDEEIKEKLELEDSEFIHIIKQNGAGVGIVMGNGSKKAKENADYITTDVGEDGIYNALKVFKFIK